VISTLRNDIETIKRQIRRIKDEITEFNRLKDRADDKKKKLELILEGEKKDRIKQLEEAKAEV